MLEMLSLTCFRILPENVLVQQACILQSNLEKATKDNASLHQKIGMCIYYFGCLLQYHKNLLTCDLFADVQEERTSSVRITEKWSTIIK